MPAEAIRAEVLIVGAGPVGLALAIELGRRGVRCLVVERNERHGFQPRAKTTNVRSMEHMRRWGIAEAIRRAAPLPAGWPSDIVFATRLSGSPIARFDNAFFCARGRDERFSESAQWIPQYTVEAVMRAHVATLPAVTLRAGLRVDAFEQTPQGVAARAIDIASGAPLALSARWLVGADGARSTVREGLGIALEGRHGFARNLNLIFRAPGLSARHALGPAIMYWLVNADAPAIMGPMDRGDTWFFITAGLQDGREVGAEDAKAMIRRASGLDFDMEIIATDPWLSHSLIAPRYGAGRVFLAGDACHLHPPFGGYGMNMGIGDAVDLGWKLAAVLRGWGGPALLDSYEAERRPVAEWVVDEAVANNATVANAFVREGLERADAAGEEARRRLGAAILESKPREFHALGVVLGCHYSGSPIVVPDGSPPPPRHPTRYQPSAHPGCLAPHAWLADGASLYDRFGDGFTLLATAADAEAGIAPLVEAARRRGVPLVVLAPADERLARLYGARLALIRPDQHVCWRGDAVPADPEGLIDRIRGASR